MDGLIDDSSDAHVHCPRCGREMRPDKSCVGCGFSWLFAPLPVGLPPLSPAGAPAPAAAGATPAPAAARAKPTHAPAFIGRPHPSRHRGPSLAHGPGRLPGDPARPPVLRMPPAPAAPPSPAVPAVPVPRPASPATPYSRPTPSAKRGFQPIDIWKRYLPPVRLVWIFLGIIAAYVGAFQSGAVAGPILMIPIVGAFTDLTFQRLKFPRLRFPDAALATSMFLSLIIWPASIDLALVSIAVASASLRHVLRFGGHPLVNPAALGIALATVVFGMPTSWHVGLTAGDAAFIAVLGSILIVRAPHTYRFIVYFFGSYLPLTIIATAALGGASHLVEILATGALGPAMIFYGFFMVTEPRTAPSNRRMMILYSIIVGASAALIPFAFNLVPALAPAGVLFTLLALFIGNIFTVVLPNARGARQPVARPAARPVAKSVASASGDS